MVSTYLVDTVSGRVCTLCPGAARTSCPSSA